MSQQAHFVGGYVDDMARVISASLVSGVHALFIGKPGTGKTAISKAACKQVFGDDGYVFIRISTTTPVDALRGVIDYQRYLEDSVLTVNKDGSAYDPKARAVILDEAGRGNDPLWDESLDVTDRQDIPKTEAPSVIMTANFMPVSDRTEAMRDRVGLWCWLNGDQPDTRATVRAMMGSYANKHELTLSQPLPTADEVHKIRHAIPGPKAIEAVADVVELLSNEAQLGVPAAAGNPDAAQSTVVSFDVNRRRIEQWQRLLFSFAMWITGTDNFDEVPDTAKTILKYAYPLETREMAGRWAEITDALIDPIASAIEAMEKECYRVFKQAYDESEKDRRKMASVMGIHLGDIAQKFGDLADQLGIAEDDERLDNAVVKLGEMYSRASIGEDPFQT